MISPYVFQVATPFSTGTGVYLPDHGLVVTNEHLVRDNSTVVIGSETSAEQLAKVVSVFYTTLHLPPKRLL